jgi:hypothetical protein
MIPDIDGRERVYGIHILKCSFKWLGFGKVRANDQPQSAAMIKTKASLRRKMLAKRCRVIGIVELSTGGADRNVPGEHGFTTVHAYAAQFPGS